MPFLEPILLQFSIAFSRYQHKNLLISYDAVQTLADHVGTALDRQEHIHVLLPCLIQKWSNLSDDDRDLFPLLECMSSVTVALGSSFGLMRLLFSIDVFE